MNKAPTKLSLTLLDELVNMAQDASLKLWSDGRWKTVRLAADVRPDGSWCCVLLTPEGKPTMMMHPEQAALMAGLTVKDLASRLGLELAYNVSLSAGVPEGEPEWPTKK